MTPELKERVLERYYDRIINESASAWLKKKWAGFKAWAKRNKAPIILAAYFSFIAGMIYHIKNKAPISADRGEYTGNSYDYASGGAYEEFKKKWDEWAKGNFGGFKDGHYQSASVKVSAAYKTLGLKAGASAAEIKAAYRAMSKKWHPDVNKAPNALEKMAEINNAYDLLSEMAKAA